MGEWLEVRNWSKYQHYSHRSPPWIKLHRSLLDDHAFMMLADCKKVLLIFIWLLASENDGKVPADINELRWRLRKNIEEIDVKLLIEKGFLNGKLICASNTLAESKQGASEMVVQSREEKRREDSLSSDTTYPQKDSAPRVALKFLDKPFWDEEKTPRWEKMEKNFRSKRIPLNPYEFFNRMEGTFNREDILVCLEKLSQVDLEAQDTYWSYGTGILKQLTADRKRSMTKTSAKRHEEENEAHKEEEREWLENHKNQSLI